MKVTTIKHYSLMDGPTAIMALFDEQLAGLFR